MKNEKKAIYVHGLGSGAASSTIGIVRKVFPEYEWTAVEVNEDPAASVDVINQAIVQLHPAFLMGTSLGGLYLMYADMSSCEDGAIRFLFNPACDIARIIREKIGFGMKEYFVPRQDGVQQYELSEAVCARFEDYIAGHQVTQGRGKDYAMFSTEDELIGPEGVSRNQAICYDAGYRILIDLEGGHRLKKAALRKACKHLFDDNQSEFRIGDRILLKSKEPDIYFSRYAYGATIPRFAKKREYIGIILDCYPDPMFDMYSASTLLPVTGFLCSMVFRKDIIRLATNEDMERLGASCWDESTLEKRDNE